MGRAVRSLPDRRVIDYADPATRHLRVPIFRARDCLADDTAWWGGVPSTIRGARAGSRGGGTASLSTVTVSRPDLRQSLRRPGDALSRASIGTVPILWLNTGTDDPMTILDEVARTGYEGTQYGTGFPQGD